MTSYLTKLSDWTATQRQVSRLRNKKTLAAFLAVRDDVEAAIDAGFARKTIWEHMHETGRISFRYETFLKHVKRHITRAPAAKRKGRDKAKPKASSESKKSETPTSSGFAFNPTLKKEDLC
jgi:hypothetical protein